jgi:multicomponent Na+:H+ antiporter subunit C
VTLFTVYSLAATGLFAVSVLGFFRQRDLVRKIVALNVMGSSVFLLLVAIAYRNRDPFPDPVPQAMVLTGIVIAVSTTALAVALARRIDAETGRRMLPEDEDM